METDLYKLLSENEFFKDVDIEIIEKIDKSYFQIKNYKTDEQILKQNDEADEVYLIVSGKVKVVMLMPDGKEIFITYREKNDFFGEMALLEDKRRSASIYAVTSVKLIVITRDIFLLLLDSIHQINMNLTTSISAKWRKSEQIYGLLLEKFKIINTQNKKLEKLNREKENLINEKEILNEELKKKNHQLYNMAITDKLTNIYNRAYIMDILSKEFTRSERHKLELSCIIIDIDHFKGFNDTYGHLIGDFTLKKTAELIKNNLRNEDVLGRYGGEEFLIVLPSTNIDGAEIIAEKIRSIVDNTEYHINDLSFKVTISLGVSNSMIDNPQTEDILLKNADVALYKAKNSGRNRIVLYSKS